MPEIAEHLQDPAGDPEAALDRLVRVGVAAERNRAADVPLFSQLLGEQRGGVRLIEESALEIEAGRQAEIGMTRPCVTINAAVLAATVRIDRTVEADIR